MQTPVHRWWSGAVLFVLVALAIGACALVSNVQAAPLENAFRYQGRLGESGVPAQGRYDLRFALFETATDGNAMTGPLTFLGVGVTNGLFGVTLDFGTNVFTGQSRWLEIAVRPAVSNENSGADFVTLAPRQLLTPVPYSIYTLKAESLAGPLAVSLLPTNVARLDGNQTFAGVVSFKTNVTVEGAVRAGTYTGSGAGLTNVAADGLSARLSERMWRIPIPFVTVTNAGNPPDITGKGAVPYNYRIGKY